MLFELCFLFLERGIWFFVIWGEFTCVWKRLFEEMCFIREIHFVNMKLLTILRLFLFIGVFGLKINKIKIMSWVVMFSPLSDESEEFFLKCIYYFVYLMINYLILFNWFNLLNINDAKLWFTNCWFNFFLKFVLLSIILSLFIFGEVLSFILTSSLINELSIGNLIQFALLNHLLFFNRTCW